MPSKFAAFLCVVIFLMLTIFTIASIVLPAIDWVALVPERIGKVRVHPGMGVTGRVRTCPASALDGHRQRASDTEAIEMAAHGGAGRVPAGAWYLVDELPRRTQTAVPNAVRQQVRRQAEQLISSFAVEKRGETVSGSAPRR